MELLPEVLAAFDSRKRAMMKNIAELIHTPTTKLAQVLGSLADDVKQQGQAYDDRQSVMPQVAAEGRQQTLDDGMNVAGMFVGPGAKLHPATMRRMAEYLDYEKNTPQSILDKINDRKVVLEGGRQETGWFRNPADKMLRTEVSDQLADMTPAWSQAGIGQTYKLPDVFAHEDLYNLYPQLREHVAYKGNRGNSSAGTYFPPGTQSEGSRPAIMVREDLPPDQQRLTFLHELQHAIQQIEGFAKGGSVESTGAQAYADDMARQMWPEYKSLFESERDAQHAIQQMMPRWRYEYYNRLAGENEARLTEARANMGNKGRMDNGLMPDVPWRGQIAVGQSGPAFSADPKSQLAPYQHAVYDRLIAMGHDPTSALQKTRELTNLMTGGQPATPTPQP